jgi:hypothetical protein
MTNSKKIRGLLMAAGVFLLTTGVSSAQCGWWCWGAPDGGSAAEYIAVIGALSWGAMYVRSRIAKR